MRYYVTWLWFNPKNSHAQKLNEPIDADSLADAKRQARERWGEAVVAVTPDERTAETLADFVKNTW